MKIIGCTSILMMIFSIINFIVPLPIISFLAIAISGKINYLFYEYYSTQKVEYTSLSGIISIGQIPFRGLEMLISFKENYCYLIQFCFSLIVVILCKVYSSLEFETYNIYYENTNLLNN